MRIVVFVAFLLFTTADGQRPPFFEPPIIRPLGPFDPANVILNSNNNNNVGGSGGSVGQAFVFEGSNARPILPRRPLVPAPAVCEDNLPSCAEQARQGQCRSNPSIMLRYCKLSCQACDGRVILGGNNNNFNQQHTPPPPPVEVTRQTRDRNDANRPADDCTDVSPNCVGWAQHNGCGNDKWSWMQQYCKKSCSIGCAVLPPTTTTQQPQTTTTTPAATTEHDSFTRKKPVSLARTHRRGVRRLFNPDPGFCPVGCVQDPDAKRLPSQPPNIPLNENELPCHVVSATVSCCKDDYVECAELYHTGGCDSDAWLQKHCQWSCGICLRQSPLTDDQMITIKEVCSDIDCKTQPTAVMDFRDNLLVQLQKVGYTQFEARHSIDLTMEANRALLRRDGIDENIDPYYDGTYAGVLLTIEQAKAVIDYLQGKTQQLQAQPLSTIARQISASTNAHLGGPDITNSEDFRIRQRQKRQTEIEKRMLNLWEEMPIRYVIDDQFDMMQKSKIRRALEDIVYASTSSHSSATRCIEFIELQPNATHDVTHYITFRKDNSTLPDGQSALTFRSRCALGHYGRVRRNVIFVNFGCENLQDANMVSVVQQAVLRTLGVGAQHQRRDRHRHIKIVNHLMDHQAYSSYAQNPFVESNYALPYDYDSITHPNTRFIRWADKESLGCGRNLVATRLKNGELVRDDVATHRLNRHKQDGLSIGDVHALQRLYCVSKSCREGEHIECGYWVGDDPLLCERSAAVKQYCPRLCGDLRRGCHV